MADEEPNLLGLDDADLALLKALDVPGNELEEKARYIVREYLRSLALDVLVDAELKGRH